MNFLRTHRKWLPLLLALLLMSVATLSFIGCNGSTDKTPPPAVDTTAPTVPTGLVATPMSAVQIDLTWAGCTDNMGVAGYRIFRDGVAMDTAAATSYSDTGLTEDTQYCYTVSAYDAAGNASAQSAQVCATTLTSGLTQATNVFLDSILPDQNYTFMHGSSSHDGTRMFITVNKASAPQGTITGVADLYMLDAGELEKGAVAEVQTAGQITGAGGAASVTFRSTWSDDDSMIALAGADRIWIIDSTDMTPLHAGGNAGVGGQVHDAMFTSDGKYAVMAIRTNLAGPKDGEIQLYDVVNDTVVGNSVSVCNACHPGTDATLCGLDGAITESGGTYSGTIYVAGHGGHIAKVPLTINPADTTNPISVGALSRVVVSTVKFAPGAAGGLSQYKLHDVRIDTAANALFWSTYNTDANGKVHYGRNNLSTGDLEADVAVAVDPRATLPAMGINTMPIYCASGQTADYFMPITMTNEAYISVIPKSSVTGIATPPPAGVVSKVTNVFLDSILPDPNYTFFHGSTSHDGSKMFMAVNKSTSPQSGSNGTADLYMLNAPNLEKATVTQIGSAGQITGAGASSITFRSTWSLDDSKIALAGADRIWIIDSATLAPVFAGGNTGIGGQVHDAMFTTDGQYAVMAIRTNLPSPKDGELQLYDVVNDTVVGNSVSVCNACHPGTDATLCGLDGEVGGVPGYPYTGTIYVAGHGGHVAVVDVTIDPADTTNPITVNSLGRIVVSSVKFAAGDPGEFTSQYKLHDVRLEGDVLDGTLYWSTYNTDANGQLHYGKIDLATSAVTDKAIDVDARATLPDRSVENRNKMPMYCASGQTAGHFMPITMTHEAYISVIPKLLIK